MENLTNIIKLRQIQIFLYKLATFGSHQNKPDRLNIFSDFGVQQGYENLFMSNHSLY